MTPWFAVGTAITSALSAAGMSASVNDRLEQLDHSVHTIVVVGGGRSTAAAAARRHPTARVVLVGGSPVASPEDRVRTVAPDDSLEMLVAVVAGRRATTTQTFIDLTDTQLDELTTREREVLHELTLPGTVLEIADRLDISPHTARTHVRNIARKLSASNRVELVAIARRAGTARGDDLVGQARRVAS